MDRVDRVKHGETIMVDTEECGPDAVHGEC